MPMTPAQRARRIAIVTCHALRNLAYYRVGQREGKLVLDGEFWKTVNGNFIDICVLEWCKLFGDAKGKHSWRKVFDTSQVFSAGLLDALQVSQTEFDDYVAEMRTYRDRFIAHLDDFSTMNIPNLDYAKKSLIYLYDCLVAIENSATFVSGLPFQASAYFCKSSEEANAAYL